MLAPEPLILPGVSEPRVARRRQNVIRAIVSIESIGSAVQIAMGAAVTAHVGPLWEDPGL
jgi:hypothetical protein